MASEMILTAEQQDSIDNLVRAFVRAYDSFPGELKCIRMGNEGFEPAVIFEVDGEVLDTKKMKETKGD